MENEVGNKVGTKDSVMLGLVNIRVGRGGGMGGTKVASLVSDPVMLGLVDPRGDATKLAELASISVGARAGNTQRETSASRHHGDPIEGPLNTIVL